MEENDSHQEGQFRLRSYQTEMVNESLNRNIIVAMDTGSVSSAVARAAAALETCEPDKFVWFLVPTVNLCLQQHGVFKRYLPAYPVRTISSLDNVNLWTNQKIWDAVLKDIRVVVSTYAVLHDALTHGFVNMSRLALLIFDEAHHCVAKSPANLIMRDFYFPELRKGNRQRVPRILGLSASPVMRGRSELLELSTIEANLDSRIIAPKVHRQELLRHVHTPKLNWLTFTPISLPGGEDMDYFPSTIMRSLKDIFENYDIGKDPYVIHLQSRDELDTLFKIYCNGKTYCTDQLRSLKQKMEHIAKELGLLAAERFIRRCVSNYVASVDKTHSAWPTVDQAEKMFLADLLRPLLVMNSMSDRITLDDTPGALNLYLTDKATVLAKILQEENSSMFRGIVFVEQRATVAALQDLISIHPELKTKYQVGVSVGESDRSERSRGICSSVELGDKGRSLEAFRTGKLNLLLATSVLEEGVDIPECHVIICFDAPKHLTSFVQRRGRARKKDSKYFILCPEGNLESNSKDWDELESRMMTAYLDDSRSVQMQSLEGHSHDTRSRVFRVEGSNALLTLENSVAHLYHFCSTIQRGSYVDLQPVFSYQDTDGAFIGHVILPTAVPPQLRTARGSLPSVSRVHARKEAAFEAMVILYKNGLISRNLLPIISDPECRPSNGVKTSTVLSSAPYDPWERATWAAQQNLERDSPYFRYLITVADCGTDKFSLVLVSRFQWPQIRSFDLFWTKATKYVLSVQPLSSCRINGAQLANLQELSKIILRSAFPASCHDASIDYLIYVMPHIPMKDIENIVELVRGSDDAIDVLRDENIAAAVSNGGLIRFSLQRSRYILKDWARKSDQANLADVTIAVADCNDSIVVSKFPRRKHFHLSHSPDSIPDETREIAIPLEQCQIDRLPAKYSLCALFIPSLFRRLELAMVAEELNRTLLQTLEIRDLSLVQAAITSTAAREAENYERLEYLGDCLLKFLTSIQLLYEFPNWSEEYLTEAKSHRVSNSTLARACLDAKLDRFLIEKAWNTTSWQPPSYERRTVEGREQDTVMRSTKTIADIVESIIGASYLEGGLQKAHECLQVLLPLQQWTETDIAVESLFSAADAAPVHLEVLERMIGYKFMKASLLLEAMTHPSFHSFSEDQAISYQRLEFLGDSLLDYLLVQKIFAHSATLKPGVMTSIRAALANRDYLGFLCLDLSTQQEPFDISRSPDGILEQQSIEERQHLWEFLRHASDSMMEIFQVTAERHKKFQKQIQSALAEDRIFPWKLLAHLSPEKLFSDMIESILGAIFVDSQGDVAPCSAFLDRLGVFTLLERLISEHVICFHPVSRLGNLTAARHESVTYDFGNTGNDEYKVVEVLIGGKPVGPTGIIIKGHHKTPMYTIAASDALSFLVGE